MERFIKGDVVVVPFPFTDLSTMKRRPALVITDLKGDDIIICQITSRMSKDIYSITIDNNDFEKGGLNRKSNIRPNRLVTIDGNIMIKKIGNVKTDKVNEVISEIKRFLDG